MGDNQLTTVYDPAFALRKAIASVGEIKHLAGQHGQKDHERYHYIEDYLSVEKHLAGEHDQSTHASHLASDQIQTSRGSVLALEAPTMENYRALQNELADWDTSRSMHAQSALRDMLGLNVSSEYSMPKMDGFVVRDKGEFVGVVSFYDADRVLNVSELATKRTGYAPAIMQQIAGVAVARSKGVELMSVNATSNRFYKAIGMHPTATTRSGGVYYEWSLDDARKFSQYRGA